MDFEREPVPGMVNGRCYFETPCGWCTRIFKQCDAKSCSASRAVDSAKVEATTSAQGQNTKKFTASVYNSFRKEVCSGCSDLRCDRDECEINACAKFVNYFEI